jgi:hypothetical protein
MKAAGAKAKPAAMVAVALNKLPWPTGDNTLPLHCHNRKIAPMSAEAEALSPNAATTHPIEAQSELVDASSSAPLHTTVSAPSALSCSSPAKEVTEDDLKHKKGDVEASEDDQMNGPKQPLSSRHRLVQSSASLGICGAENMCPVCGFPRPVQTGATQLAEALEEARSLKRQLEEARGLKNSVEAGETQTGNVKKHGCWKMPVGGGFQEYKKILVAEQRERYLGKAATEISKLVGETWRNAEEEVKRPFVQEFHAKLGVWKRPRSLDVKALAGHMVLYVALWSMASNAIRKKPQHNISVYMIHINDLGMRVQFPRGSRLGLPSQLSKGSSCLGQSSRVSNGCLGQSSRVSKGSPFLGPSGRVYNAQCTTTCMPMLL